MRDHDVAEMLDRAVATVELPAGFTARIIAGGRARRRRRLLLSGGALVVVMALAALLVAPDGPAGRGRGEAISVAGPSIEPRVLVGIVGSDGRPATAERVVAVGRTGTETLVVLRRAARAGEMTSGGHAAEVWIVADGGDQSRSLDYLSYDLACVDGDQVCDDVRSTGGGLGLAVARRSGGRLFVLAQAPEGRTVEVVANGVRHPVGAAPRGAVVEVDADEPYDEVQVWATMADGRRYRIVWAPGAVLPD
ncbi:hypothetical protein JOD64_004487 [Micromonospora luteifusca]|uniref:Uncharacterized protein n=1 Tax=Micromonospora luteifusca TaxID=709860 RepID=A0ABS2LYK1_9ACTN|nr:hypothetical protein [Micromonospora luteifusca]MBM7493265.1 hypothetical protein [Micromonospora luteifusca]